MGLLDYSELKYLATLKKCSLDNANNEYMVESEKQVVDFDKVKTRYLNSCGKSEECAASVDALAVDTEGNMYMIEFKNGDISTQQIRNKIKDSLLIYGDITHTTLKNFRDNVIFILVYNPYVKSYTPQQKRAIALSQLGKESCPLYDLDKYDDYCVKKAYMMTAARFNNKVVDKLRVS